MNKVTIKFWNVDRQEYAPDFLSENLLAYPTGGDFEPHFYKDGERIA